VAIKCTLHTFTVIVYLLKLLFSIGLVVIRLEHIACHIMNSDYFDCILCLVILSFVLLSAKLCDGRLLCKLVCKTDNVGNGCYDQNLAENIPSFIVDAVCKYAIGKHINLNFCYHIQGQILCIFGFRNKIILCTDFC
jgi:hypothetical protein